MTLQLVLSAASPLVAVVIALWGFRRRDRAAELEVLFELHERYLAQRVRDGRRLIHRKLAGRGEEGLRSCTAEELSTIGYTLAVMNTIALCCRSGRLDSRLLQQSLGQSYTRAVNGALSFIDSMETTRGVRPYPYAEWLVRHFSATAPRSWLPRLPLRPDDV
ncbi:hypothetical protein [Streptomyces sp. NPDC046988]|uniref:DUF4760 domain-containing protein n=1 Tax=Streptomyces sp. NPDC046988 TaxID=3154922 RepID=UPI003408EF58